VPFSSKQGRRLSASMHSNLQSRGLGQHPVGPVPCTTARLHGCVCAG
jgi:hypothetical protein